MLCRVVKTEGRRRWRVFVAPPLAAGFVLLVLRLGAGGSAIARNEPLALSPGPTAPDPVVLSADGTGILLEWKAPSFSERWVAGADGQSYVLLGAPGWALAEVAGHPQLPYATALVVVPADADLALRVAVHESDLRELPYPVLPAGQLTAGGGYVWSFDPGAYEGSQPAEIVALEEAGWIRGHRLVRLTFFPIRFNAAGPSVETAVSVRVELTFEYEGSTLAVDQRGDGGDDPVLASLAQAVVNPGAVGAFARFEPVPQSGAAARAALAATAAPTDTEYLIITHPSFVTSIEALATHRESTDGLTVYITTTDAIHDAYPTLGVSEAIRTYISATYHSVTTPTLSYVLLVGDGAENPDATQYVPPYLVPDPWASEQEGAYPYGTAADNRYGEMSGGTDQLAEIHVGRLPVRTAAEATLVVNKIINYETDPPQWPWNERLLFFAGDEDHGAAGGEFHDYADSVYASIPITYAGYRVYFCQGTCTESHLYDDIHDAHNSTISALNVGGLLASYVGHSSWHQWAVDPLASTPNWMLHVNDVPGLQSSSGLPVVLNMTCYTGRFAHSTDDALDELMIRRAGGGAVATWGNTTLGLSGGQNMLHELFYEAVFEEGLTELGPAISYAKVGLPGTYADLLDSFVLLGDPAMDLNMTIVPWTGELYLPLALRSY
jgi:hypothetical protein